MKSNHMRSYVTRYEMFASVMVDKEENEERKRDLLQKCLKVHLMCFIPLPLGS